RRDLAVDRRDAQTRCPRGIVTRDRTAGGGTQHGGGGVVADAQFGSDDRTRGTGACGGGPGSGAFQDGKRHLFSLLKPGRGRDVPTRTATVARERGRQLSADGGNNTVPASAAAADPAPRSRR